MSLSSGYIITIGTIRYQYGLYYRFWPWVSWSRKVWCQTNTPTFVGTICLSPSWQKTPSSWFLPPWYETSTNFSWANCPLPKQNKSHTLLSLQRLIHRLFGNMALSVFWSSVCEAASDYPTRVVILISREPSAFVVGLGYESRPTMHWLRLLLFSMLSGGLHLPCTRFSKASRRMPSSIFP